MTTHGNPVLAPEGRSPHRCPVALLPFVDAGVLTAADVHVATTLARLLDDGAPEVLLAAALAARAPRVGHTCLDVDAVAGAVAEELPPSDDEPAHDLIDRLPWPDPDDWLEVVSASPLASEHAGLQVSPLVVEGRRVFLRRYRDHELRVADDLRRRAAATTAVDEVRLERLLDRLFPDADADDPQRRAARAAALRRLTVVAGGPGTGKTWTVARILAVLVDQAGAAGDSLQIALVAPTGKAAARLGEGIDQALAEMDLPGDVHDRIAAVGRGQTIHRLLGRRSKSRFRHDRDRPLAHDVIVVDETSMASLSLTAHLLDAVRPDARVVIVGDPDQLASVEAGSVLADVVGPIYGTGAPTPGELPQDEGIGRSIVVLRRPRRFGEDSGIGQLARAIRAADTDGALELMAVRDDLDWIPAVDPDPDDLVGIRGRVTERGRRQVAAARAGDIGGALDVLGELAVLCAHRRGRHGVAGWNARIDDWLSQDLDGWQPREPWQAGRAVLATGNDRQLGVFNGDLGVVVETDAGLRIAFPAGTPPVPPVRLEQAEPMHTMTIHKSQGSQWGHVVVVLPPAGSRILTRELLYTAVTRAEDGLTVIGAADVIRAAIARPVRRASGLRDRLWTR